MGTGKKSGKESQFQTGCEDVLKSWHPVWGEHREGASLPQHIKPDCHGENLL